MKTFLGRRWFFIVALALMSYCRMSAQTTTSQSGVLQGQVCDPSGALVPHTTITAVSPDGKTVNGISDAAGKYRISGLLATIYSVTATAKGFAAFHAENIEVSMGSTQVLNVTLTIEVEQQVEVEAETQKVGTDPDSNANAIVLKGADLNALSDDPEELLGELQALAGPSAGPSGGQIYIDGFTGGQLPPKSCIREIRINQNPFSAEYDRLGYGRIEILTKPGTDTLHGEIGARGNDSSFNSRNPLLIGAPPAYSSYDLRGSIGGSISKAVSFFVSGLSRNHQNTSVLNATDPASITSANPSGNLLNEAFNNPNNGLDLSGRIDVQAGKSNTLTFRCDLSRAVNKNQGLGQTNLQSQAYDTHTIENELQLSDSIVLTKALVDDVRFQYRRIRTQQTAQNTSPTVSVQGAFTDGGSNSGTSQDNQDDYEMQDYLAAVVGGHSLNFGGRARVYRDANTTNAGSNGAYTFQSTSDYLTRSPQKYSVNIINNPTAQVALFDAALFYQDDWKVRPFLTFSYGLRWETQNHIHDKSDWAPRVSFAYALGGHDSKKPAKTVLRGGYGWFYQRFTVPGSFASLSGTPYLTTAVHQNGVNQIGYTVTDPTGYQESSPGIAVRPPTPTSNDSAPTHYSLTKNFHAANDMQAAIGIDRQLTKHTTSNITYLYSRGVHQYLTNNTGAAVFPTVSTGTYPEQPIPAASSNLMQFQSGGVYRESQLTATLSARYRLYSISGFYTYSNARGDTNGTTYVPSVAQDPGFDYGRSSFDLHHRFVIVGNINAPMGLVLSPEFVYNSGTPFNVTAGNDLTGNSQFNARPTFADPARCSGSATQYVATPYGCLDDAPTGTGERIVPYGLGTGPENIALNLHLSKAFGIGPRGRSSGVDSPGGPPPPLGGGPGGLGAGGLGNGPRGPAPPTNALSPRKFSLGFSVVVHNLFNYQNLGVPNGVLSAPLSLRFKSQSLAGGPFNPPEGGNRSIFLETRFSF